MKKIGFSFLNLSKREGSALYFAIGIVLFSLVYNFILEPMLKRCASLDEQILTKEIRLKKNLRTINQREFIQSEDAKLVNLTDMEGKDEEKIAKLLSDIEREANDALVQITDMKPLQTKDFQYYRKFIIDLEAEASIENLSRFIYDLYNSPQFLRIERLQLTCLTAVRDVKGGQSNILNCHMIITKLD